MITVVTMYRGSDAEFFVQVVEGQLSAEQRDVWRQTMNCDDHYEGNEDDINNLFFLELPGPISAQETADLVNVDGEEPPETLEEYHERLGDMITELGIPDPRVAALVESNGHADPEEPPGCFNINVMITSPTNEEINEDACIGVELPEPITESEAKELAWRLAQQVETYVRNVRPDFLHTDITT